MASLFEILLANIEVITITLYVGISITLLMYWRERKKRREVQEITLRNTEISQRLNYLSKEIAETSSALAESRLSFEHLDEEQKRSIIKLLENYEDLSNKSNFDIVIEVNQENLKEFDWEGVDGK